MKLNPTLKKAIISVLVGATVAFLTTLLEGLLGLFNGPESPIVGGIAGGLSFIKKWNIIRSV